MQDFASKQVNGGASSYPPHTHTHTTPARKDRLGIEWESIALSEIKFNDKMAQPVTLNWNELHLPRDKWDWIQFVKLKESQSST
jgi:hypothetical protein